MTTFQNPSQDVIAGYLKNAQTIAESCPLPCSNAVDRIGGFLFSSQTVVKKA